MDQNLTDRLYRFLVSSNLSHPFSVERARALDEWAVSPEYRAILDGHASVAVPSAGARSCPACHQANAAVAKFCTGCGAPLGPR
jgi:hypothetical protein